MQVKFGKRYMDLKNKPIEVGDNAPDFKATARDLSEKHLHDFKADIIVISTAPSIDTSLCAFQTKKFNQLLFEKANVQLITITNDLPFAQSRWCEGEGLENATILSDHNTLDFSLNYGVLIEAVRLLARAVFILDKNRKIIYKEIVEDTGQHPNYDQALNIIDTL